MSSTTTPPEDPSFKRDRDATEAWKAGGPYVETPRGVGVEVPPEQLLGDGLGMNRGTYEVIYLALDQSGDRIGLTFDATSQHAANLFGKRSTPDGFLFLTVVPR